MSKFGQPANIPDTGFGTDTDYPECIHYQLEYQISAEHTFKQFFFSRQGAGAPWTPEVRKGGEVQIWVRLRKRIIPNRDCGEIPKTQTSTDDPCEFCENSSIKRASHFYIKDLKGETQKWDELSEDYTKQACTPDIPTIGPPKTPIVRANGLYGFSCIKDWFQCGRDKRLEDIITPGMDKKLDFDQSPIGGSENDEREYNIVCKLYKMFIAAKKSKNDCAECELLCKIINNTIFGDIGSKSGGKPGDCDYHGDIPLLGDIYNETCEVRTGLAFEKWLDEELDNDTEDPGYPFEIEECPGCPGCD